MTSSSAFPAYFEAGRYRTLPDDDALDGNRLYHPTGWIHENGELRLPIEHRDEPGADGDVDLIMRPDGTTYVRRHRRTA